MNDAKSGPLTQILKSTCAIPCAAYLGEGPITGVVVVKLNLLRPLFGETYSLNVDKNPSLISQGQMAPIPKSQGRGNEV